MLRMPYFEPVPGFSSTFILAMVTWPCISVAISSSMGPIILHGPHHSALKSTSTGPEDFNTSLSKLASVTALVAAPIGISKVYVLLLFSARTHIYQDAGKYSVNSIKFG